MNSSDTIEIPTNKYTKLKKYPTASNTFGKIAVPGTSTQLLKINYNNM